MNFILLRIRNWWIDFQVNRLEPLPEKYGYCLVGGSQAPVNKYALFHHDEGFLSPCSMNEVNCGSVAGEWIPEIQMLSLPDPANGEN